MDINIENKVLNCYNQCQKQEKRTVETVETVVPDTCGDISRVSSTVTDVFLKSKENENGKMVIRGEAQATVIYINETEDSFDFVKLNKLFSIEYECDEAVNEALTHCKLSIANYETKILNPRKVSISFEILCELVIFKEGSVCVQDSILNTEELTIYTLPAECESSVSRLINEKTFSLTEQYMLSSQILTQQDIICAKSTFSVESSQIIGTKLIVKGRVYSKLIYRTQNGKIPISADFNSPFSQVIDTGFDNLSECEAHIELTSMYYELIDTINGDKALELELHAVMMINASEKVKINYISDAYCNTACIDYKCEKAYFPAQTERLSKEFEVKSEVDVSADCAEILCVAFTLNHTDKVSQNINMEIGADVIYRKISGEYASVHRVITSQQTLDSASALIQEAIIIEDTYEANGNMFNACIKILVNLSSKKINEVNRITEIHYIEREKGTTERIPTFSVVHPEGESLWLLAKEYNSSENYIKEYNKLEDAENKILLIPKAP